jgi:hypothetical protein
MNNDTIQTHQQKKGLNFGFWIAFNVSKKTPRLK